MNCLDHVQEVADVTDEAIRDLDQGPGQEKILERDEMATREKDHDRTVVLDLEMIDADVTSHDPNQGLFSVMKDLARENEADLSRENAVKMEIPKME